MTFHEALDVLGVTLPCNARDAAKAFRKRARETHPDHGGTDADFIRVTEALRIAHLGLADAMSGRGEVEWDRETGDLSWRTIARRQMSTKATAAGTEVNIGLTPQQTDRLMTGGLEAGARALGQVLSEGARAFREANPPRRKLPKLPPPE